MGMKVGCRQNWVGCILNSNQILARQRRVAAGGGANLHLKRSLLLAAAVVVRLF